MARGVCLAAVCAAVGFSLLFAARHNRTADRVPAQPPTATSVPVESQESPLAPPVAPAAQARMQRGREVFEEQRCSSCHSIAGTGNPRNPLDGIGARLRVEEYRPWITGTGFAADLLAPSVAKRKQRYLSIPPEDQDALIEYLASLR